MANTMRQANSNHVYRLNSCQRLHLDSKSVWSVKMFWMKKSVSCEVAFEIKLGRGAPELQPSVR